MNTEIPGLNETADFEDDGFPYHRILNWAQSDKGAGLPYVSAQPFANWLDNNWNDYDDGTGSQTNEDILKGALDFWTGRS